MPLKLSLKPGEKFVLNGAVLANGDKRTPRRDQQRDEGKRFTESERKHDRRRPQRMVAHEIGDVADDVFDGHAQPLACGATTR